MAAFSPLQPWLDRKDTLKAFAIIDTQKPNKEYGGFLAFDIAVPLHEIDKLKAESLRTSWEKTNKYVQKSFQLISAEEPVWLDCEEVEIILTELGQPPMCCYPIYMISVGSLFSIRNGSLL